MKTKNPTYLFIFVACVAALIAGCGGKDAVSREDQQAAAFADLRSAVEEVVAEDNRRADIMRLIDGLELDINSLRASLVERRTEFRRLNADYDTTREELTEFANAMEVRIQEDRRRVFDGRARLIAATTDEEWDALTKVDTRAMKAVARSIQGL